LKRTSSSYFHSPKIVKLRQLQAIARKLRRRGKRMVFTNGCFDILHVGHACYLEEARQLGDYLVVALNSDASVRKLKGPTRPINRQFHRARLLAALASVDYIVIFGTKRIHPVFRLLKPEIYVKGGDYTEESLDPSERRLIHSIGSKIYILPVYKGFSTTALLKKIQS
jgi:rfaE bifunctional protein nucleotidyltransferase chain/domain